MEVIATASTTSTSVMPLAFSALSRLPPMKPAPPVSIIMESLSSRPPTENSVVSSACPERTIDRVCAPGEGVQRNSPLTRARAWLSSIQSESARAWARDEHDALRV